MEQMELDIKVMKIHRLPDGERIKAFVDLGINDALLIKGIRVVHGKKGLFVSMPSEQGKNEVWYERVRCLNKDVKGLIEQTVLDAYQEQP
jgi:stage V sporulation protein G